MDAGIEGAAPVGVPLLVDLTGQRVVVIGAGPIAAAKLRSLAPAGADLLVIAPDAVASVREAADAGELTWERRTYDEGDLDGAVLVVAATSDPDVNAAVTAAAARGATLCVRVDGRSAGDAAGGAGGAGGAAAGSAAFMGAVRRGPMTVAVASGAPALSRWLRADLAARYGDEWGVLASLLGGLRTDPRVRAWLSDLDDAARAARWRSILDTDILSLIRLGRIDSAKEVALACLSSSSG